MNMKSLCCQSFTIYLSPEELWENYEHYILNKGESPDANGHGQFIDHEISAPMLLYQGKSFKNPITGTVQPGACHHYACIHLIDSKCSIYDQKRPYMCTAYPQSRCEYKQCESTYCQYYGSWDWKWYNHPTREEIIQKVTPLVVGTKLRQ